MEKFWPVFITMLIALLAVAIAYRVKVLHKLVFGTGSAKLNEAAKMAADAPHQQVVS
jgi:hypothetical protein